MANPFEVADRGLRLARIAGKVATAAIPLFLASCGGGGGGSSAPSNSAPVFTSQPAAQTAGLGNPAVFTAACSGTPTPTYQWSRSNDRGTTWATIPGATASTYTLAAASLNDNNAQFRLAATNSQGSVNSLGAALAVTAAVGQATQIPLTANAAPLGLAAGPDGNMWFAYPSAGAIGILQAITHVILTVPLTNPACEPTGICAGPDGRMWYTEQATGNIGAISLDGAHQTSYPALGLKPTGITQGPDLALWYTLPGSNLIGRVTPSGVASTFPVTTPGAGPLGITQGTDGNLWFTEQAVGRIARITPSGTLTEWVVPTPSGGKAPSPQGIVSKSDGSIWFADLANNVLVKFQSSAGSASNARARGGAKAADAGGTASLFTTVSLPANAQPVGVTLDGNGALWAADQGTGQVTQVSPSGTSATFTLPTTTGQPTNLAIGSDGNLFVTQAATSAVAQVVTAPPATTVGIAILPAAVTAAPGGTAQFTVQVTGAPDTSATWSIQEGASGGTVSSTGLYTAPAGGGPFHVVATSSADATKAATASVTVASVVVSPGAPAVPLGGTQQFTASVTGPSGTSQAVAWTALNGTVTTSGLYTAPATGTTDTVTATSTQYPGISGQATVTLSPSTARFNDPEGVAVDQSGNVYVADYMNNMIRKVTPEGYVSTLAGAGGAGAANGPGVGATFFRPVKPAVDTAGNVYVADSSNNMIRMITPGVWFRPWQARGRRVPPTARVPAPRSTIPAVSPWTLPETSTWLTSATT